MSLPKTALREALADPSLALPDVAESAGHGTRRAARLRAGLLSLTLFLVPLLTYWPTTFHDYGLRDDYSNLREAHEEPVTVLNFCASQARPVYGWLLQATFGQTNSVQGLEWMRLAASLLLGSLSLVMFRALRAYGWSFGPSLCFAWLLALVPSAQVIAAWAIGWPYAATTLLAVAGFFTMESALGLAASAGLRRAALPGALGIALMVIATLTYQPSALFYVVPLAAALIAQRRRSMEATLRWLAVHLGAVLAALGVAYASMSVLYAAGIFKKSGRVAFEQHWGGKIAWFLQETLPNGLSLFVLNDNNHRDHLFYAACAGLVSVILLAGLAVEWRRHGAGRGLVWAVGLFGLPVFAAGVSLVASERFATYRTIFAMTGVLLCFLIASLHLLTERWSPAAVRVLVGVVGALALYMAQHHAYALIAVPQGNEWQLIVDGAKQVRLDGPSRPRIFAIASAPADASTATIYHDEFGSLSSNSEWVPKEMFKRAMHDLHPDVPNLESRYDFTEGYLMTAGRVPPGGHYDVVIDLHRLRRYRTDN